MDMIENGQKKSIWGFRAEIGISEEDLYAIIFKVSKKESMRALTKRQANEVIMQLISLKDKKNGKVPQKRTDKNGKPWTKQQRKKIYALTDELGWNDNNARINGFCKRMFKVERVEWLEDDQCSKMIEILKKMIKRQEVEAEKALNGY